MANRAVLLAVSVPVLLGTVAAAVFVATEAAGVTPPLAESAPQNLSEAAGLGSVPDVWRYLDEGQNPFTRYEVRPHIVSSSIRQVTPGEAAVWSRRVELIAFLDRRNALGDDATRAHLACLAAELKTEDILEYLVADRPPSCPDPIIDRIAARTR